MIKVATVLVLIAAAAFGFSASAQFRADARTSPSAIGNSSSNGVSFAWFYDAKERTVYVCRIGQATGDTLDCKANATLP